jgi:hypothetical protein
MVMVRSNQLHSFLVALVVALVTVAPTSEAAAKKDTDPRITKAKEFFEQYVALEQAFDPKIVDLYADDATIRNKRTSAAGEVSETTTPAPKYKEKIRIAMPFSQARGDVNGYSEISFAIEGEGVRITAQRYIERKKTFIPISLLIKPNGAGVWLIYEEITETQV